MKTNVEKLDNSKVALNIDIDAELLEEGLARAYRKVVRDLSVPGFRKGKVPRFILEKQFGQSVLFEDALDYLFPKVYKEAVDQTGIRPVDQPSLDVESIEPGEGAVLKVEVDVYPEVTLGEYRGIKAEKEIETVTDEDVEESLNSLRERHTELVAVDDRDDIQEGDTVVLDFIGYVDGEPFAGGAAEDHSLEIGSGQFIPGFEEQLVGLERGAEADITVGFPEEYRNEDLAGKEAVFHVTIKDIKEKQLPELDDEFARDAGEFETLDELRASVREDLEQQATDRTRTKLENKIVDAIIETTEVELPDSMVERQAERMLQQFSQQLMYQGMTLANFCQMTGQTEEEFKESMMPDAVRHLKSDLILEQIAEAEDITVSDEEIDAKIEEFVQDHPEPEAVREDYQRYREGIADSIKMEKTMDFLIDQAEITEVPASSSTPGAEDAPSGSEDPQE